MARGVVQTYRSLVGTHDDEDLNKAPSCLGPQGEGLPRSLNELVLIDTGRDSLIDCDPVLLSIDLDIRVVVMLLLAWAGRHGGRAGAMLVDSLMDSCRCPARLAYSRRQDK